MVQKPTPQQQAFLLAPQRDVLYGGAAGGGKSSAVLLASLQYVDVPSYAAIIFRRTYADLSRPGALMDRAAEWLGGTSARWNEQKKMWRFPSGASLSFGYLEHTNDIYAYQGAEFQFIAFEELTQFYQPQFRYLFSRLRKLKGSDVPLRVRNSSNPGGIGHEWVYNRYFVDRKPDRLFIPAKLDDNPHLDREEYEKSLDELDPVTRHQLRHGDWDVRPAGDLFKREWFKYFDRGPTGNVQWVRYWDLASTAEDPKKDPDWTAGALVGVETTDTKKKVLWVADVERFRGDPGETEEKIRAVAQHDGKGVPIWIEEEPGSSGKNNTFNYTNRVLFGFAVTPHRKTGNKMEFWKPLSAVARNAGINLVRGRWNSAVVDELVALPNGGHDDAADAISGGLSRLTIGQSLTGLGIVGNRRY